MVGRAPPRSVAAIGEAEVGGTFALKTSAGKVVRDADLRGRVSILYFGATADDGISVAALTILGAALQRLGARSDVISVYFVGLDPEHDGPERLQAFLEKHLPRAVALTGPANEINDLSSKYKLYYKKIVDPSLPIGHVIEHASLYYIMNRDGAYAAHVPYTTSLEDLVREISVHLD
ncbi:MAG: SCO family protein [Hyphomicrobiaceae bacterium]